MSSSKGMRELLLLWVCFLIIDVYAGEPASGAGGDPVVEARVQEKPDIIVKTESIGVPTWLMQGVVWIFGIASLVGGVKIGRHPASLLCYEGFKEGFMVCFGGIFSVCGKIKQWKNTPSSPTQSMISGEVASFFQKKKSLHCDVDYMQWLRLVNAIDHPTCLVRSAVECTTTDRNTGQKSAGEIQPGWELYKISQKGAPDIKGKPAIQAILQDYGRLQTPCTVHFHVSESIYQQAQSHTESVASPYGGEPLLQTQDIGYSNPYGVVGNPPSRRFNNTPYNPSTPGAYGGGSNIGSNIGSNVQPPGRQSGAYVMNTTQSMFPSSTGVLAAPPPPGVFEAQNNVGFSFGGQPGGRDPSPRELGFFTR